MILKIEHALRSMYDHELCLGVIVPFSQIGTCLFIYNQTRARALEPASQYAITLNIGFDCNDVYD